MGKKNQKTANNYNRNNFVDRVRNSHLQVRANVWSLEDNCNKLLESEDLKLKGIFR
jgi:hypothetical protein